MIDKKKERLPERIFFLVYKENRNIVLGPYKEPKKTTNNSGKEIYDLIEFIVCKKTGDYIKPLKNE